MIELNDTITVDKKDCYFFCYLQLTRAVWSAVITSFSKVYKTRSS